MLLTISLQEKLLKQIRHEAKCRQTNVSALLRDAFLAYTQGPELAYTDDEIKAILKADKISRDLRLFLDRKIEKAA